MNGTESRLLLHTAAALIDAAASLIAGAGYADEAMAAREASTALRLLLDSDEDTGNAGLTPAPVTPIAARARDAAEVFAEDAATRCARCGLAMTNPDEMTLFKGIAMHREACPAAEPEPGDVAPPEPGDRCECSDLRSDHEGEGGLGRCRTCNSDPGIWASCQGFRLAWPAAKLRGE